jgi:hypothetical protein
MVEKRREERRRGWCARERGVKRGVVLCCSDSGSGSGGGSDGSGSVWDSGLRTAWTADRGVRECVREGSGRGEERERECRESVEGGEREERRVGVGMGVERPVEERWRASGEERKREERRGSS